MVGMAPEAKAVGRKSTSLLPPLLQAKIADDPTTEQDIKIQTFRWTSLSLGWYLSLIWGNIYKSDPGRVWIGTSIKLFNVLSQKNEISIRSPRGAVDAVGDTIARRIGSLNIYNNNNNQQTMREV
jgi:hypothetical protein